MPKKMQAESRKDSLRFGYYFVASIDILNQKEALRQFKELPQGEPEKNEFIRMAKKTFGVVDGVRSLFDEFFASYNKPEHLNRQIPRELQMELDKIRRANVKSQRFMDTIIIYVSLADDPHVLPINGIYSALIASASTFVCSLAAGHALRGGIEVGIAAEMCDGEIYGPAVYEAHHLENEIAKYPRLVIGKGLINYLFGKKNVEPSDLKGRFVSQMAGTCLRLLTQDVDGHPILDYLGEGFMERVDYLLLRDDTHLKAYNFVVKQADLWKKEQKTELSFRYALLRKYFDARLALWNKIQKEQDRTK